VKIISETVNSLTQYVFSQHYSENYQQNDIKKEETKAHMSFLV